ncbi:MAG: calcium/proton exchanger [Thermoplasmata archaeon]
MDPARARWAVPAFFATTAIPVTLFFLGADPLLLLIVSSLAVLPLAYLMGVATEELAKHMGPALGGLFNVSFGNAVEIIIGIAALRAGLVQLVQASLTGSIIGNILLVLGLSMLAGGLRHKRQTFERRAATTRSTLLVLATVGLVMPSLFVLATADPVPQGTLITVTIAIAVLLLVAYGGALLFSFHTHRHLFNPRGEMEGEVVHWSRGYAVLILGVATALVAVVSEVLIETVKVSIEEFGFSQLFLGVIVISIVGNAAEHGSAVVLAWRNRMNLSVSIALSSSTQIALFAAPFLVFASLIIGNVLTFSFGIFELIAIGLAVAIAGAVANDGESNWFEGMMLLIVYAIIAVAFFFLPSV